MIPELNINIDFPDIDFDLSMFEKGFETRYIKGKIAKDIPQRKIKYANAQKLAKAIDLSSGERYNCIVSGSFIFGDFIEAFIVENNAKCKKMTISTLSLDQNNVDSLANLLNGGFVDELNLIISDYFYAHERNSIVPYIYKSLDIDNRFQLAAAGSHTKIAMFETLGGKKIVVHGSANLRSSNNIEQFVIENNAELYDFYNEYHDKIIQEYKTINKDSPNPKSLRAKELWNIVEKNNKDGKEKSSNNPKQ